MWSKYFDNRFFFRPRQPFHFVCILVLRPLLMRLVVPPNWPSEHENKNKWKYTKLKWGFRLWISSHSREFSRVQSLIKRASNGGNFQAPQNTCCNSSPLSMLLFLAHSRQTWFDFVVGFAQFSLPHSSTHPTHKAKRRKSLDRKSNGKLIRDKKNFLLILFFRRPFNS